MKNKILDVIFFIGGTIITIYSIGAGIYHKSGKIKLGASRLGLSDWAIIGLTLGICMIVFGFLRRNWDKKEKE